MQNELGDVVFVELPEVGATVTKGENFGVVESVKAASDVYSPVTGEVLERNDSLTETPALVSTLSGNMYVNAFVVVYGSAFR